MGRAMAEYRLFCFDGTGRILLADWVNAESNEAAITAARSMKDFTKCEVWQSEHLVATVQGGRAIYAEFRSIV